MSYLQGRNKSHTYLKRFFAETDKVDPEATFTFEDSNGAWNSMPYGVVIEGIMGTGAVEQEAIANMIRRIDMADGNVRHYLRHLGKGMAEMRLSVG